MQAALTVHHGDIVVLEGSLPAHAKSILKRSGAFEDGDNLVCTPDTWPRLEGLLRGLGVPLEAIGTPQVAVPVQVPESRPKAASVMLEHGRIRIQGDLPKPMMTHWLGSERAAGHIGMSPWALEDYVRACKDQNIALTIEPAVEDLRERLMLRRRAIDDILTSMDGPTVEVCDGELRDYQRQALAFGEACNGRFLLADMVGGGKTITAIGWARFACAQRVVVICPTIVKGGWRDQIRRFDGSESTVLDGFARDGYRIPTNRKWTITGYDTLQDRIDKKGTRTHTGWFHALKAWKPDLVVVDESHYVKGTDSDRAVAVRQLARHIGFVLPMSGTPQANTALDLWSQLDALEPGWWGTWFEFGVAFCDGQQKKRWFGKGKFRYYWDMNGSSNADVLNERLRYVMLRRTKEQIGSHLPPQSRILQTFDLSDGFRAKYDKVMAEYRAFVTGIDTRLDDAQGDDDREREVDAQSRGQRMQFVMKLRQLSSGGRVEGTVEFVRNLVEQGKRPVVFAYFTDTLHALRDHLSKGPKGKDGLRVGFIDGSVPRPKRDDIKAQFIAKGYDVLVGQTEAAGVGLDGLQEVSDTTVTHDLTYKPIDIEQTEGRVYRSGQKMPAFHYYCLGENTRDKKTLDIVLAKMANSKAVLDSGVNVEDEVRRAIEAEFFQEVRR